MPRRMWWHPLYGNAYDPRDDQGRQEHGPILAPLMTYLETLHAAFVTGITTTRKDGAGVSGSKQEAQYEVCPGLTRSQVAP